MVETVAVAGMFPWEIPTVLGAVVLSIARWLPPRVRWPAVLAGTGGVAVSSAALLLADALRWQVIPVFVGAAIALPFALVPLLRQLAGHEVRRARRWPAVPATAATLLLIATGPLAAWALPTPSFPPPSGPYAVGTAVVEWTDPDRPENFTPDPDDHRTVPVQLWYPAQAGAPDADRAYNGARTEREARQIQNALANSFGLPRFLVSDAASARTSAVFDASVAEDAGRRMPIVVFSPGLTGVRTSNTVLAQEWASHGYVVATLDHPYDSALTFVDGRPARSRNWATVTDDRAKERQYTKDNIDTRVGDVSFVLSQLERLDRGEISGPLAGRLDITRAAVAGHSRGGATAFAAARDPRFAAVINIDGGLRDTDVRPFDQPALAITAPASVEENADFLPALDRVLDPGAATTYRLSIPGTGHFSFADAALYFPPLPALLGTVGRTEGLRITADATTSFLNSSLRDEPGDLAERLDAYGDLTVYE